MVTKRLDLAPLAVAPHTPARTAHPPRQPTWGPLVAWTVLVGLGSFLVYQVVLGPGARLDAAPLHAAIDPRLALWVVVPVVVVGLATIFAIRASSFLSWGWLMVASASTSALWSTSLAASRGWIRVVGQLQRPGEYLAVIPRIDSIGTFLRGFDAHIRSFPIHVQGHPPGFVTLTWLLSQVGLGGPVSMSLLCISAGALAVPATLVTVRDVADEAWARRAAPFVAISPAAIWIATSADAFYTGVGATAIALVVLATGRADRRGDIYALFGGLLFGVIAFLSYGLVLLAVVPIVIAVRRGRPRPIALAALGAVPVFLAFLALGFWWLDGLFATRARYFAGIASRRPYELYLLADLSSFAIALGPAIAVALVRLRDKKLWLLVGAALLAVALADLSGMSKAEVERIWLPFSPFILASGAVLVAPLSDLSSQARRLPRGSGWLAVQAGLALLIEIFIRTAW